MLDAGNTRQRLPKPGLLRREIAIALLVKILLLTGLWFLIFRWPDKPVAKPDIAVRFALPAVQNPMKPDFSSQPAKESRHDR